MTKRSAVHLLSAAIVSCHVAVWGAVTGSIAGTVYDQTGSVIFGVTVTVTNNAQGIQNKTTSDAKGVYTFPCLPVGRYDIKMETQGFKPQNRNGLVIDVDSAIQVDMTLELAEKVEAVTVTESDTHVETESTQ